MGRTLRSFACVGIVLSLLPALPPAPTVTGEEPGVLSELPVPPGAAERLAPNEIMVLFKPGTSARAIDDITRREKTAVLSVNPATGVHTIKVPAGERQADLLGRYEKLPEVEWAEPNRWVRLAGVGAGVAMAPVVPNDAEYNANQKWYYDLMSAEGGWGQTTGSSSVVIAIVDSGVLCTHPDLAGKMWTNPGEIAGNGIDDDGNGYVDDVNGWDFVGSENGSGFEADSQDANPCITSGNSSAGNGLDDDGDGSADGGVFHGTFVAGVAAAASNNGTGVAGVCWNCKVMAVRVANPEGWIRTSDSQLGITYAAQRGAKVINLSYGGSFLSQAEKLAVQSAVTTYGAVVVAASGNENHSPISCPACVPEAIAVGGSDRFDPDGRASFSNWGASSAGGSPHASDVVAPGVQIRSTSVTTPTAGATYATGSGTSFSTPLTAGLAGLILSKYPALTPAGVKARLMGTAVDLPDDPDDSPNAGADWDGAGMINFQRALTDPTKLAVTQISPGTPSPAPSTFSVTVQAQDAGGVPAGVGVATTVTLTREAGTGTLGGTLTGSIPAGATGTTITGVTYSKVENGVSLRASATGLTPGVSASFNLGLTPAIALSPPSLSASVGQGGTAVQTLTISNTVGAGGQSLTFEVSETAPVSPAPSGGGGGGGGSVPAVPQSPSRSCACHCEADEGGPWQSGVGVVSPPPDCHVALSPTATPPAPRNDSSAGLLINCLILCGDLPPYEWVAGTRRDVQGEPSEPRGWQRPDGRRDATPPAPVNRPAVSVLPAVINDPTGDYTPNGDPSVVDIIKVEAGASPTEVTFKITFSANTVMSAISGYFDLDTDQNPNTGYTPFANPNQDTGGDYSLDFFVQSLGFLDIYSYTSGFVGSVTRTVSGKVMEFTIPLNMLGNDDGNLNFSMALGNAAYATDWAPNSGHGTVTAVEPGIPWLTESPASGTVAPQGNQAVTVTFNSTGLTPGTYTGSLYVSHNDGTPNPVVVPVTFTVTSEPAPLTWVRMGRTGITATTMDSARGLDGDPSFVLATGIESNGATSIYRSTNAHQGSLTAWTKVYTDTVAPGTRFSSVQTAPGFTAATGTAYIAHRDVSIDQVLKSTNGGGTWAPTTTDPGSISIRSVRMADASVVFAGSDDGYVWKSTNGGATWTQGGTDMGGQVLQIPRPRTFATDNTVVAGVKNAAGTAMEVWISQDGGTTWTQVGSSAAAWGSIVNASNSFSVNTSPNWSTDHTIFATARGSLNQDIFRTVVNLANPAASAWQPLGSTLAAQPFNDGFDLDLATGIGDGIVIHIRNNTAAGVPNTIWRTWHPKTVSAATWSDLASSTPNPTGSRLDALDVKDTADGTRILAITPTEVWSFLQPASFLTPPALSSPAAGAVLPTNSSSAITLSWDAVPGAITYRVQVLNAGGTKSVDQVVSGTSYTVPLGKLSNGAWTWRARVETVAAGTHPGPWAERSFTTAVLYTLTVTTSGTGTGTVISVPPGISCGSTCSGSFVSGTSVTLTPTPSAGSVFAAWTGASDCSDGVVAMTGNITCNAVFNPASYTLTVTKAGSGVGTLYSNPLGITCGSACTLALPPGTVVTLTATPDGNSYFAGWSGDTDCSDGSVTMAANRSCTGTFNLVPSTLTVNSTADAVDATPGNGVCSTATGVCTLRAAVMEANALAGHQTIVLPAGTHTLTIAGQGEEAAATGDLDVTGDLTISGTGAGTTTVQAGTSLAASVDRVFHVVSGVSLTLSGITVRYGKPGLSSGGGIFSAGTLSVTDSVIQNNEGSGGGGAIYSHIGARLTLVRTTVASNMAAGEGGGLHIRSNLSATITDSTIAGNSSLNSGGGIYNEGMLVTITRSSITGNSGGGFGGGGIYSGVTAITGSTISQNTTTNSGGGVAGAADVVNSTISGNTAAFGGGGSSAAGTITGSTVTANSAPSSTGGGIRVGLGVNLTIRQTIIAGNSSQGFSDCTGTLISQGYNLVQDLGIDTGGCTLSGTLTGNLVGVAPALAALAENGGATTTHALLPGSPAIDAVPSADCTTLTTDQRGYPRPRDGDGNGTVLCDIGAFEYQNATTAFTSPFPARGAHRFGFGIPAKVEVLNGGSRDTGNSAAEITLQLTSASANGAAITCGGGTATRTPSSGLATFSGCGVDKIGSGYYLQAVPKAPDITGAVASTPITVGCAADADASTSVDIVDFSQLLRTFGKTLALHPTQFNPTVDFDGSETTDIVDFSILVARFGQGCS